VFVEHVQKCAARLPQHRFHPTCWRDWTGVDRSVEALDDVEVRLGLQEYPQTLDRLVLATGERADVVVSPQGAPGEELVLMSLLYNRGYGSIEYREQPLP
jgi:hypothetical protein